MAKKPEKKPNPKPPYMQHIEEAHDDPEPEPPESTRLVQHSVLPFDPPESTRLVQLAVLPFDPLLEKSAALVALDSQGQIWVYRDEMNHRRWVHLRMEMQFPESTK